MVITSPVRARDLRSNIQEMGFERGVATTIERFLEEFAQHRQHMREMAELLSLCIEQTSKMVHVSEEVTRRMDQIKRDQDKGNEISHEA